MFTCCFRRQRGIPQPERALKIGRPLAPHFAEVQGFGACSRMIGYGASGRPQRTGCRCTHGEGPVSRGPVFGPLFAPPPPPAGWQTWDAPASGARRSWHRLADGPKWRRWSPPAPLPPAPRRQLLYACRCLKSSQVRGLYGAHGFSKPIRIASSRVCPRMPAGKQLSRLGCDCACRDAGEVLPCVAHSSKWRQSAFRGKRWRPDVPAVSWKRCVCVCEVIEHTHGGAGKNNKSRQALILLPCAVMFPILASPDHRKHRIGPSLVCRGLGTHVGQGGARYCAQYWRRK